MKAILQKSTYFLLILILTINIDAQTPQQMTPLKGGERILWVGNSFSSFNGPLWEAINALFQASTPAITNVHFQSRGKGMGILKEYATWKSLHVIDTIRNGHWDYVVLQGWEDAYKRRDEELHENGTSNPNYTGTQAQSQDSMLIYLKILDAEIKKIGAKTILFEPHVGTWDYLPTFPASRLTYSNLIKQTSVFYAPITLAWDSVRKDYPVTQYACKSATSDGFINMLYSDCGHQGYTGVALDAYTFYTIFTGGKSAVGLKPSHEVFLKCDPIYVNYLAGIGHKIGLDILKINNSLSNEKPAVSPSIPTNLQVSQIGTYSAKLTWNASTDNTGVQGYIIYNNGVVFSGSSTNSVTLTGLISSTNFSVSIKAYDMSGNFSNASSVLNFKTLFSSVGSKLSGKVIGGKTDAYDGVSIKEKAMDGFTSTFFWSTSASGSWVGLDLGTKDTISQIRLYTRSGYTSKVVGGKFQASNTADFSSGVVDFYTISTDPGLAWVQALTNNSTPFRYVRYLSADNGYGNVAELEFYGFKGLSVSDSVKPTAPSNLRTTGLSQTTFTLAWNASTDNVAVVQYNVYMDGVLYGNTISTETNMPIPYLTAGKSYNMSVKAKDAVGNLSDESPILKVTTLITGVASQTNEIFSVYPVPAFDILNIDINTDIFNIEIMGTSGSVVLKENNKKQIDISELESGLYFIKMTSQDGIIVKSFIKQ